MNEQTKQFHINRKIILSRMIQALNEADRLILLNIDENDPVYIKAFDELESAMNDAQSFLIESFPQTVVSSQFH